MAQSSSSRVPYALGRLTLAPIALCSALLFVGALNAQEQEQIRPAEVNDDDKSTKKAGATTTLDIEAAVGNLPYFAIEPYNQKPVKGLVFSTLGYGGAAMTIGLGMGSAISWVSYVDYVPDASTFAALVPQKAEAKPILYFQQLRFQRWLPG
ncbi:MAG: hypothetical protein GY822_04755 [Deltaproteobacteria bacterium]|nr:hypothetical protein [Deltaproteobacteria bacterium]